MRRYIQDLPLKTSTVSDYNVGVSALADASFCFTPMKQKCSAGIATGRKGKKGKDKNEKIQE